MITPNQQTTLTHPQQSTLLTSTLLLFDFSVSPPLLKSELPDTSSECVEWIEDTLRRGLVEAAKQHDEEIFFQCYQALDQCMSIDMEKQKHFYLTGNVVYLLTAYEFIRHFSWHEAVQGLFQLTLKSPRNPTRTQRSSPLQMMRDIYADTTPALFSTMAYSFIERVLEDGPDALDKARGELLKIECNEDEKGALSLLCDYISRKYEEEILPNVANFEGKSRVHQRL